MLKAKKLDIRIVKICIGFIKILYNTIINKEWTYGDKYNKKTIKK